MKRYLLILKNTRGEEVSTVIEADSFESYNKTVTFYRTIKKDAKLVKRMKLYNDSENESISSFNDWVSVVEVPEAPK
jgi:hypothetical protein